MKSYITILVAVLFASCFGLPCFAGCPSADLTGDCFVDFNDFAVFAEQWLTSGEPYPILNGMTWVSIDDPDEYIEEEMGILDDIPINDAGFQGYMGKYEVTNDQYCQYLNAAQDAGDVNVHTDPTDGHNKVYSTSDYLLSQPYYDLDGPGSTDDGATNGGAARINYDGYGLFTVDSGFGTHPVTYVSRYGAIAFCNHYDGYRLPTKQEWQAVADYSTGSGYIYGCGTSINNNIANYLGSTHLDGTTIIGSMGDPLGYGYGLCDMAGNVSEWTSPNNGVFCGGCWDYPEVYCKVSVCCQNVPGFMHYNVGFRVCKNF